jgi:hypothetical protein
MNASPDRMVEHAERKEARLKETFSNVQVRGNQIDHRRDGETDLYIVTLWSRTASVV